MKFGEALGRMKCGEKVKLPEWGGYCFWDDEQKTVMIQHRAPNPDTDKDLYAIWECPDVEYIMGAILFGNWVIADEHNCEALSNDVFFDFGTAIKCMKCGAKVYRKAWNGKNMFIFLADDLNFHTEANLSCVQHLEGKLTLPSLVMKTADDKFCVGWLASQTDMLAEDWAVIWEV